MNSVKIIPSKLNGVVDIPPSKSVSHRSIICAGLSEGISEIDNVIFSEDILATLDGMTSFGVTYEVLEKQNGRYKLVIQGKYPLDVQNKNIDCRESGSTIRFLIPIACVAGQEVTFLGKGKLVKRPLNEYYKIFEKQNIKYKNQNGNLPLTIEGKLKSDKFEIRGDISSQFISGLMFALPLLNGDSEIDIITNLESKGYVDLTIDMLSKFKVEVENIDYKKFIIKEIKNTPHKTIMLKETIHRLPFGL